MVRNKKEIIIKKEKTVTKKRNPINILAISILFKYISIVVYVVGFGFAIFGHYFTFILAILLSIIALGISIFYDILFIIKVLRGDSN